VSTSGKPAFLLVVLVVLLAVAANVSAQNQIVSQPQPVNNGSPGVMVAPPSVYVIAGGIYGTGVYVAPPATLPVQNTGISLANQAGISLTAPLQTGVTTAVPATAGYANGIPAYTYNGVIPAAAVPTETGAAETGRLINDVGPSYFAGVAPSNAGAAAPTEAMAAGPSLGEIAAQYKSGHPQNVRVYTNADAERMVASVKTGSAGSQPVSESGQTQMALNSPPLPTSRSEGQSQSSATSSTTGQSQSATQPAGPTTPQVNPPAQSSEKGEESLPATATILPFLGFLGLLSGGAGLWLIKFRK
jgi:hypothetical protein